MNREIVTDAASHTFTFGFALADGSWDEIVWDILHPEAPVRPQYAANDMTPDANVVVGTAWNEFPHPDWASSDSFAWVFRRGEEGPTWLASAGDRIESADVTSDDGSVVVGCCDGDDSVRSLPVAWYGDDDPVTLPGLPGVREFCRVNDLSGDGRIAVGRCAALAVRWVDGTPIAIPVPDGEVPDYTTVAHAADRISSDGTTIFGYSYFQGGPAGGWIWTEAAGVRSIHQILSEAGIKVVTGDRRLGNAVDVSDDGTVILGFGEEGFGASYFTFLWRATLP